LIRLADLRVRQDRFEEARQLLDGLEGDLEAARPLAAIHLSNGETSVASDILERALEQVDTESTATAPLLALLVDVHLAADQHEAAEIAADRLATCANRHASDYLLATAALARARVCLASSSGDPHACLREALAGFARAQMPMEVARSRLELATALVAEHPEVAAAEARTALDAFDRLEAARHADAAAAVLRSLGVRATPARRGGGLLTKREAEVLDLLGLGLSNPEISDRLFISRKTVEHHVGSVLSKLDLRGRAEAAAYATRAKSGPE
jgi:DNA-binding NarL/FixJ family response regulator